MSFNTQEKEIIKWGLDNKKSKEEVKSAIIKYRGAQIGVKPEEAVAPEEQDKSFAERISGNIQEKGDKIVEILDDNTKSPLERGVAATATAFSGISSTAYEALPEGARNMLDKVGGGIGKGFSWLTDKIGSSKFLQEAVGTPITQPDGTVKYEVNDLGKLESGLKIASDLGIISGEILLADQASKAAKVLDKGIETVVDKTVETGAKLRDVIAKKDFTKYPEQIKTALSDKITRIDPKVKNVLDDTSVEKFDRYVKVGEGAIKDSRKLTPLEEAGEYVNNKLLPTIKEDLNKIGSQKAKTLSSIGTQKAPGIATEAVDYIRSKTQSLKMTPAERKLVESVVKELEKLGKNPTLGSADKTVDLMQAMFFEKAKGMAIPVTSRVKAVINQTIGKLNGSVKTVARNALKSEEYSLLNDAYATRVNLFNKFNMAMGTEGAKGGSLFKRFFSPQDAGIKQLFAEVKDVYGVDLAQDAVLAKFVMESLGDTRANSFLQGVPLSKQALLNRVVDKVEDYLTDPLGKARNIITEKAGVKPKVVTPKAPVKTPPVAPVVTPADATAEAIKKVNAIPESQVNMTIDHAITSAEQVLSELPKAELTKLGGLGKLLKQTHADIVLELKGKGLTEIADKVAKLKMAGVKSLDDLQTKILEITKGI